MKIFIFNDFFYRFVGKNLKYCWFPMVFLEISWKIIKNHQDFKFFRTKRFKKSLKIKIFKIFDFLHIGFSMKFTYTKGIGSTMLGSLRTTERKILTCLYSYICILAYMRVEFLGFLMIFPYFLHFVRLYLDEYWELDKK